MALRSSFLVPLVLCAALSVAAVEPRAGGTESCETPEFSGMAGQTILVGFAGQSEKDEGVRAVRRQIADGLVGGVVLFPENIASPEQLKSLTAYLSNARSKPRPFIAVDQEGGKVQRLDRWNGHSGFPSAESVAKTPSYASPEAAMRLYGEMAKELAEAGFNMNLAPVVDLNLNPGNPVIGARGRSFGADPAVVTSLAASFIKAHRAANIATVAKHFPGHGSSTVDSHKALADVSETWREVELEPYRLLAEEGLLDAVMTGHLYHPRFSDTKDMPASLSAKTVRALRNKNWLDFQGVVISDDMEMGAVRDLDTPEELAVKAIKTGTDIVVFSNVKSSDPELGEKVHAGLVEAVCDGRLSETRIRKAYAKVMALKRRLADKDLAGKG